MLRGGIGNAVLAPISEVLARLVVQVTDTAMAAKDVLIERESFSELGSYLEKILPVLRELHDKNVRDTPPMRVSLESLEREMKKAQELIQLCGSKSRIYLLLHCRTLVKQVQDITHEIGRCLSLIPLASMNISVDSREVTSKLLVDMQSAQFRAAAADEELVEKIELGIRDQRTDSAFANDLLLQIARSVGVPQNTLALAQELEEFKKEKEEAELRKNRAEAYQLEQIIGLLSAANVKNGGSGEFHRVTGSNWQYMPFYCQLTRALMEDPVEIASGQTFERSAIEKWFRDGNTVCPVTGVELDSFELKPNHSLRSAIEESRDRSTRYNIEACGRKIKSQEDTEVQAGLWELHRLSEERPRNPTWIAEAGLLPVIVSLLESKQRATRMKTLAALSSLAAGNENKERIMDAGALPLTVRSLSRDGEERKEAVKLLLELSKVPRICDQIGKAQGCILLLATLRNEIESAVQDATALLDALSNNSQNVVQMAEANYFRPLAVRLAEGSDKDKILMASAIARMGLTDQGKATLAQDGAIGPLVKMISLGNLEAKSAALGALQNLSTLPDNRDEMIAAGVVPSLLRLLCSVTSSLVTLKEQAAATFANLASSPANTSKSNEVLESEDTLVQLLSLLNLAGPEIQGHLLRALYGIATSRDAAGARNILRAADAIQLLLPFCENSDSGVRVYALKLLFCLSGDGSGREISEFLGPTSFKTLVDVLSATWSSDEEKAAAVGILGNLPSTDNQVIERLLQAGALPPTLNLLDGVVRGTRAMPKSVQDSVVENSVAVLLHFTRPAREDLQRLAADHGAVSRLVDVLSAGSPLARARAATGLAQFSESSRRLSTPVARSSAGLFSCFFRPRETGCELHQGHCSERGSFCMLEAKAVAPLIQCLEASEAQVQEAALAALATLLHDEIWQKGVKVIADARGIRSLVRVITFGTPEAKEKALWMLEKVFRIDRYRNEFGSSAQMPLIELTSRGNSVTRPMAARILAHLQVLHSQSSYF
ncbi:hypothetical protein SELMODRAFT_77081 [Selaginella moellendorffii]|uniref:RING-type E3 ubiquitin transferase n=1 Tax=Selaginella moellendorffii TaxID=88036 RepID=D8QRE1_SELML|nr:U-box domain-containing protein 43 isoform X2 [Selaginella moellendorffii]EFJ37231.1 hypothetical protein SELMODRAFT_77081 [Selaginella moellendorffii]|eukprot:XP_002961971.1 U-box domain-containing protein 43 isoform X2 [Selaginella moellendorffii]